METGNVKPVVTTNALSSQGHGAYKEKDDYKAYLQVRKTIRESHSTSLPKVIQFVEGGLTGIPIAEYRESPTLVNEIAEKFFMQVKGLLVMELESKIEMYVLAPLSHKKGSDDDLHQRIRNTANEFVEDE